MLVLLIPALVALLFAQLKCRSLDGWRNTQRPHWWPLGCLALAAEIMLSSTPVGEQPWAMRWGSLVWVCSMACVVVTLGRNAIARSGVARWSWGLAAVGVGINLIVVISNEGQMPQSQTARAIAGVSIERVAGLASRPGWHNVAPMTPTTRLAWLSDVLPEPAWLPLRNVLSLGDLLLAFGLAGAAYTLPARQPAK